MAIKIFEERPSERIPGCTEILYSPHESGRMAYNPYGGDLGRGGAQTMCLAIVDPTKWLERARWSIQLQHDKEELSQQVAYLEETLKGFRQREKELMDGIRVMMKVVDIREAGDEDEREAEDED